LPWRSYLLWFGSEMNHQEKWLRSYHVEKKVYSFQKKMYEESFLHIENPEKRFNTIFSNVLYNNRNFVLPFTKTVDADYFDLHHNQSPNINLKFSTEHINILNNVLRDLTQIVHREYTGWFHVPLPESLQKLHIIGLKENDEDESYLSIPISPSNIILIDNKVPLDIDFFDKYQSQLCVFQLCLRRVIFKPCSIGIEIQLYEINTVSPEKVSSDKDTIGSSYSFISAEKNVEKFKTKRDYFVNELNKRISSIDRELDGLTSQKESLQQQLENIQESILEMENETFEYNTDDELLEEEMESVLHL